MAMGPEGEDDGGSEITDTRTGEVGGDLGSGGITLTTCTGLSTLRDKESGHTHPLLRIPSLTLHHLQLFEPTPSSLQRHISL